MSEPHSRLKRFLDSWYFPGAIGFGLFVALAVWARPRRVGADRWDTSRLQALADLWLPALLLTVLLAWVMALVLVGRRWLFEKASAARFLAASLLIHSLLVLGMWGAPLAGTVAQRAEEIRVSQH